MGGVSARDRFRGWRRGRAGHDAAVQPAGLVEAFELFEQ